MYRLQFFDFTYLLKLTVLKAPYMYFLKMQSTNICVSKSHVEGVSMPVLFVTQTSKAMSIKCQ